MKEEEMVHARSASSSAVDAQDAPTPAGITQRQFVRGVDSINKYRDMMSAVSAAMREGGCDAPDDLGGGGLLEELTRQLCERCRDEMDPVAGTMIEYMLYDCGGPVKTLDGRRYMVQTPEALWTYWRETGEGPFS